MSKAEISQMKYADSMQKLRDEFQANFSTEEYFKRLRAIKLKNDSIQLNETLEYFREIEPQAETMESLTIQSSALAVFPPSIKRFKSLKSLTLRRCPSVGLETLFSQIKGLENLKELNIVFSDRAQLPDNIGELRYVKHLNLNGNELNNLPDGIANMASLETINLHNNPRLNIHNAAIALSKIRTLRKVKLSGCKLFNIPQSISNLSQIESLDLSLNGIGTMPASMTGLKNLKEINLSRNNKLNTEQVFKSISTIPSLERIVLNDCNLKEVPNSIESLQNLRVLNLSNNPIESISGAIGSLTKLEKLQIGTSSLLKNKIPLKKLPAEISKCINLRVLDLRLCDLNDLPSEIDKLKNLEYLDLSWNLLSEFPSSILDLSKLKYLDLSYNQINEFPEEVGAITESLETLLLKANFSAPYGHKINKMPQSISRFKNLKKLSLQDQVYEFLPDDFWTNLTKLEDLNLMGALLQEVPAGIQNFKNLKTLNLKANEIKKVSKSIIRLENLESLNISFNPEINSSEVLETLKLISNLKHLDISFNNIFKRQIEAFAAERPDMKIIKLETKDSPAYQRPGKN